MDQFKLIDHIMHWITNKTNTSKSHFWPGPSNHILCQKILAFMPRISIFITDACHPRHFAEMTGKAPRHLINPPLPPLSFSDDRILNSGDQWWLHAHFRGISPLVSSSSTSHLARRRLVSRERSFMGLYERFWMSFLLCTLERRCYSVNIRSDARRTFIRLRNEKLKKGHRENLACPFDVTSKRDMIRTALADRAPYLSPFPPSPPSHPALLHPNLPNASLPMTSRSVDPQYLLWLSWESVMKMNLSHPTPIVYI